MPRSASSLETRMPSGTDAAFLLASKGPFSGSESRPTVFSAGCPENGRAGRLSAGLSAYLSEGRRSPRSLEGCSRSCLSGRSPRSTEDRPPGPDGVCSPRRLGGRSPHSVGGLSRRPVEARSRCSEGVRSFHRLGGRSPRSVAERSPCSERGRSSRRLGIPSPGSSEDRSRRFSGERSLNPATDCPSRALTGRSPRGSNGRSFLPFPVGRSERPAGALSPGRFSPSGEDEGLGRRCVEAVAP